jgi:hypothetical protein
MKKIIIMIVVILSLNSCSKENKRNKNIVGEWKVTDMIIVFGNES